MKNTFDREHLGWIDLLRVIACFLVVFSHCCDPFIAQFDNDRPTFLTGVFSGSFVRACVPLFVMMSGVLLFPVRTGMGEFYRKRIGRILPPLVFWSVALPLLFFLYLKWISTGNPLIVPENYVPDAVWGKVSTFVFNFNFDTTPLWYLYMLVGLYLIIPILDAWMRQAEKRDLKLFLWIWGVTLLLPYVKIVAPLLGYVGNFGNMGLLGVCDWNEYGTFYYVSGFVGYLVLAYYLVKFPPAWNRRKTLGICLPMFVAGYLVTSLGYVLTQKYFPGNYANLEVVWYFAGINVFMMTFPVFLIVRRLKFRSPAWLSRAASLTFGIYLCHFIFVQAAYDLFDMPTIPAVVRILCMACAAFIAAGLLVWVFGKGRWSRLLVR